MKEDSNNFALHSKRVGVGIFVLFFAACSTVTPPPPPPLQREAMPPTIETPPALAPLQASTWSEVEGWPEERLSAAWPTFLSSCAGLLKRADRRADWQAVCALAETLEAADKDANKADANNARLRQFFETEFVPYRVVNPDASDTGIITGYYEPLLRGSRTRHDAYRYPLYAVPDDLVVVDLAGLYPELKHLRLRGRVVKGAHGVNRLLPYFSRAELSARGEMSAMSASEGNASLAEKVLFWVDDAVAAFFLQIQGSGRIQLENGDIVRVNYAEQNGHPYRSIGRWLVDQGEMRLDKASMQGIKDWLSANPQRLDELLNTNPSYVFFREMPTREPAVGPLGAFGVPLTPERSLAVDPRFIPLGAPVFLSTTQPNRAQALQRLMLAQDTGGAIRGAVRADFFWGFGDHAGELAGRMRQSGKLWVLLPRQVTVKQ